MNIQQLIPALERKGVVFAQDIKGTYNADTFAMDAQPALFTTSNAGVPAWMVNYINPGVIDVIFAPMKATEIAPERKVGDWTTATAQFPIAEVTGNVSGYDDYSNDGSVGANVNWPTRESYSYQTFLRWGEKEVAIAQQGNINQVERTEKAALVTMGKFQNKSYFLGIDGLKNYGLLNDPALSPAIAPATVGSVIKWATKTPEAIANDVAALFVQLVKQTNGTVDMDSRMKLCMSPTIQAAFANTNQYGLSARAKVKENYPNMEFVTAPEYATAGGELVQLIADEVQGQQVVETAFTEKMRAHNTVVETSSYKQKRSAGTWGAIIMVPAGIAQMIGV